MTIHIALDLETWGTDPGDDLRSIGACVFDPTAGTYGLEMPWDQPLDPMALELITMSKNDAQTFYIACDNPITTLDHYRETGERGYSDGVDKYRKYPLRRDPRTVQWWNDPERAEAAKAFDNPVDLREALRQFTVWLYDITDTPNGTPNGWPSVDLRIWGHGAAFDPPLLAAAYEAVGLPVPWHYRAPRDTRTAFDMAGIEDHSAWLQRFNTGTPHHALHDAICEARAVCGAFSTVRTWALAQLGNPCPAVVPPLPMIIHCPQCYTQHVDKPTEQWPNPPHRSHECQECGTIWRVADVPTEGVLAIETHGKADTIFFD